MPSNGPYLLALTLGAVALLLVLILAARLHAFLALLISAMTLGLAAGMKPVKVLASIQSGFGEALGFIAIVVGLGAMIGRFLEHAGGGRALADWLLAKFGREHAAWAVLISAFLVGLPIFFEVGFIILVPLVWSLARESKRSLLYYGMALMAPLTITHALVPPHPAPAAACQMFGADLGRVILYGAALSLPMAIVSGIIYGRWIAGRMFIPLPAMAEDRADEPADKGKPPAIPLVVLILLLPVILIFAATIGGGPALGFLGHPFSALLVTALAAMVAFGWMRGLDVKGISKMSVDALEPIGTLLVIMGAGGAFKQVIVDSGVGPYAGKLLVESAISPLLVVYLMAGVMRIVQGSATVAIITAAGIAAPMVKGIPGYRPEMLVLALCCGGTMLSHVNDAGFWIVNQYMGMTVPQTLKSWTMLKLIASVVGFSIVMLAQRVIGG